MVLLLVLVRVLQCLSLNELLGLFRYPAGSGCALLAGTLPLRYCAARFARLTSTWRLSVPGSVVHLVAAYNGAGHRASVDEVGQGVHWVSGSGSGRKRNRLNTKNSCTLRWVCDSFSSTGLEEVESLLTFLMYLILITRGGDVIRMMGVAFRFMQGLGWDDSLGLCWPMLLGCTILN